LLEAAPPADCAGSPQRQHPISEIPDVGKADLEALVQITNGRNEGADAIVPHVGSLHLGDLRLENHLGVVLLQPRLDVAPVERLGGLHKPIHVLPRRSRPWYLAAT
jgi:hypothetical protein